MATSVLCRVKNHIDYIYIVLTREYFTDDGLIKWFATFVFKHEIKGLDGYGEGLCPEIKEDMITHWIPLPGPPKEI